MTTIDESKKKDRPSFLLPAFAGAFSGFVTRLVTGPLDTLKIRNQLLWQHSHSLGNGSTISQQSIMQLTKAVIKEEGILALWKGTVPGMCLWISYSFVQFGIFDYLQHDTRLASMLPSSIPVSLLNGSIAGAEMKISSCH